MSEDDPYQAGPCPTCKGFANATWKHPGAPVKCINGHMWFRNTNLLASSSSDIEPKFSESDKERLKKAEDWVAKQKEEKEMASLNVVFHEVKKDGNGFYISMGVGDDATQFYCCNTQQLHPFNDYVFVGYCTNDAKRDIIQGFTTWCQEGRTEPIDHDVIHPWAIFVKSELLKVGT